MLQSFSGVVYDSGDVQNGTYFNLTNVNFETARKAKVSHFPGPL